jgi:hypothetical protein
MGRAFGSNGRTREYEKCIRGLVRKHEAKTPLNIDGEDDIKNWMRGCGLDLLGSGQGPEADL